MTKKELEKYVNKELKNKFYMHLFVTTMYFWGFGLLNYIIYSTGNALAALGSAFGIFATMKLGLREYRKMLAAKKKAGLK